MMKLMKKRFVSLVVSLACLSAVSAQVTQSYDTKVMIGGTYTPITDGTVVNLKSDSIDISNAVYTKDDTEYTKQFTARLSYRL